MGGGRVRGMSEWRTDCREREGGTREEMERERWREKERKRERRRE